MHKYSEYSIFTYMPKVLKFAEVYRENLLIYFKLCPPYRLHDHDVTMSTNSNGVSDQIIQNNSQSKFSFIRFDENFFHHVQEMCINILPK